MAHDPKDLPRIQSRLGSDTHLKGTLRFAQSVQISGRFEGLIEAGGFLYVKEGAEITADIKAREIVIAGVVRGNIEATSRLEILATGKIFGNIRTAKLRVADGVVFEGKCQMVKDPESIDVFASALEQVRESVQRA